MRVPAVALEATQTTATVSVFGYGEFAQANAGLLAAGGHRVQVLGSSINAATQICRIEGSVDSSSTSSVVFETPSDFREAVRQSQCVIAAVSGTEYGAMCEDLAPVLCSGQTLFLSGAAFGAALEVAYRMSHKRSDLALNIVELDCPFESFDVSGAGVSLSGLKKRVILAGRSLNETRAGLSIGSLLFSGVVPASNLLERGFANIQRWLQTASILFETFSPNSGEIFFGTQPSAPKQQPAVVPKEPVNAVLAVLRTEVQNLARAYGVRQLPESPQSPALDLPRSVLRQELGSRVVEDLIILSSLARIVYMPMPILDAVIELSSVVTGLDLRKEGRELSDLGLIGMDSHEIMEHVGA